MYNNTIQNAQKIVVFRVRDIYDISALLVKLWRVALLVAHNSSAEETNQSLTGLLAHLCLKKRLKWNSVWNKVPSGTLVWKVHYSIHPPYPMDQFTIWFCGISIFIIYLYDLFNHLYIEKFLRCLPSHSMYYMHKKINGNRSLCLDNYESATTIKCLNNSDECRAGSLKCTRLIRYIW